MTGVAVILAVVYVVVVFALKAIIDFDIRDVTGPVTLWPALAICGIGLLLGFLADYLRPVPKTFRQ